MTTTNAGKTNPRQSNLRTTIEIKMTRTKTAPIKKMVIRAFVLVALASCLWVVSPTLAAWAQAQPPAQAPDQSTQDQSQQGQAKQDQAGAAKSSATEKPAQAASREHQPTSIAGELAKETRESEGEQEEHADLKHSTMVQKLAKLTGLSVHGAHILALVINFAIIAIALIWAIRKNMPGVFRKRNQTIQKALEEARKASAEAGQRLSDIEARLRQMDVEIGRMQASAEKEAEGEEVRSKKAAEEELRKVIQAAEQEIAAAAKQVRRELSAHTADLALALARKQINVDSNTDQVLVRNFAAKLAEPGKPSPRNDGGRDAGLNSGREHGKDGR
ncbi:MAG: ATP synthase F0 subunit B [Terriglobales bacterium]